MIEYVIGIGFVATAILGFFIYRDFALPFISKEQETEGIEQPIPPERQPVIEFEGEELCDNKQLKGVAFKGRAFKITKVSDCVSFLLKDDYTGKVVSLKNLKFGQTLKPKVLASMSEGIVHLITCVDANNNECVWRNIDNMRKQLTEITEEKAKMHAEKHAKDIKETKNSLRSPYSRYGQDGEEEDDDIE